jgi:hypothetical protein
MRPKRDSFLPSNQAASHAQEHQGWTKQALMDAAELSPKTFDTIRKAARVRGPSHGGLSWVFSRADVEALVKRAESGTFSERGPAAAAAWRKLLAEDDE